MVWNGGSKPLVFPTRWALLGVALGGAPVWPSSGGLGFTEKSVVRRPPYYLPLKQLILYICDTYIYICLTRVDLNKVVSRQHFYCPEIKKAVQNQEFNKR